MISKSQVMGCVLEQVQPDSKSAEAFSRPSESIRRGWRYICYYILYLALYMHYPIFSFQNSPKNEVL